ncbi:Polycomb protein esc [Tolypocladium ophioglossoides CBS 100239]|uniref:Polycomb protein esc n=1 Tax=Tolypocladium ophioglossoides (strain CBS 100239) TaxID=1163406 RepID=A0A0L0MYD6_TOLOC|nr:Polycomb protein esc [Tolypocladium ophioglossoides CBS 100239]
MAATADNIFDLPKLRVSFGFENDTRFLEYDDNVAEFFDVKFCPFQPLDCDPVFAAVSKKHIVIFRLSQNSGDANPCDVINVIRDDDDEASGCCCTWSKHPITGSPYLCVGGVDAKVKIYDVSDGSLVECFVGHGGDVNDLATSPVNSSIIASASDDTSVRIWSIDPIHRAQPCLCILAGEGHSWNLLSLVWRSLFYASSLTIIGLAHAYRVPQAFHDTGRYILSAGHDQVINLWTIPDLPTEPVTTPLQVHYPHFSTSAVHSGIVDCVAFYGDQILSRACHDNVIVLWRIEGFSSDGPPPPQRAAPTPQNVVPTSKEDPGRLTRSAFVPVTSPLCPAQYTRVLEFHTPNCGPQFFMRFKLHHVPGQNPVLAFCNAAGNIFFWDLKRLTVYRDFMATLRDPRRDKGKVQLPGWLKPMIPRQRADAVGRIRTLGSDRESMASGQTGQTRQTGQAGKTGQTGQTDGNGFSAETLESWASRYSIEDPQEPLRAHKTESSSANFVGRQAAWSPGGEWCVVVGSSNTTLVLQRWARRAPANAHMSPSTYM